MIARPPTSTRTNTRCPYSTLCRSPTAPSHAIRRVTKLTGYATVVLTVLASEPDVVASAAGLAERAGLEAPTVAKLLKPLAQAGLVEAFRGAKERTSVV